MLSKKRQQDYFRERLESVLHNYGLFSKHTRAQNIHKIRVDLKKIRALLYMQKKTGGNRDPQTVKFVGKLFDQAGKIRDAQVSAALLKKMKSGSLGFFSHQREIVTKESKVFVEMVTRHVDELVRSCSRQWKSFRDIPKRKTESLNSSIVKKLRSAYIPGLKLSELHESRKFIKRLIYINTILKSNDKTRINTDCFRKLEEAIGKWHDADLTQKLVKKYSSRTSAIRILRLHKKTILASARLLARKCFNEV